MINYYLITKPGIVLGNLITLAAGFLLASGGSFNLKLFMATTIGLAFVMASACVFNNYIDRNIDRKMKRTRLRPIVVGSISGRRAIAFGIILGAIGGQILYIYTNPLTLMIAAVGFFVYVVLYSLWKRHTIYGTAIGSIAGAIPPVVGYCAVSNQFDAAALILFLMMVLWQMPHFYSIVLFNMDDYKSARIPVLPIERGVFRAKLHMIVYIIGFILVASLLTYLNYTGFLYLAVALSTGLIWLGLCFKGLYNMDFKRWGRQMFYVSLMTIFLISLAIPLDVQS